MTDAPPSEAQERTRAQKILRRTWTGASLVAAVVGIYWWAQKTGSHLPILGVAFVLQLGCALELHRMGTLAGRRFGWGLVAYALVSSGWVYFSDDPALLTPQVLAQTLLLPLLVTFSLQELLTKAPRPRLQEGVTAVWLALWTLAPLMLLPRMWLAFGANKVVCLIALSKIGDIAGYYVGNAIGKSHPFPKLSPGKTTAGCFGSLLFGALTGAWMQHQGWLGTAEGWWTGLIVGALINIAAQAGDLLESSCKRRTGVKDSSTWLGASGGFLDVLDSLFLTLPVAWLIAHLSGGAWF